MNKGLGPMNSLLGGSGMSYYVPIGDANFVKWFGADKSQWPFNTECCDNDVDFRMASCSPWCGNRCDATGECGQSGGAKCADLVKQYPCADYYAPGKQYAGWCDKQCGYGVCA